jgi:hypothetical protein
MKLRINTARWFVEVAQVIQRNDELYTVILILDFPGSKQE